MRRSSERLLTRVESLADAGHDTNEFAAQLVELLQATVPHDAACVLTIDPATLMTTGNLKFGKLAGQHGLDGEWAKIEYGSDDPTRLTVLAHTEVPAVATSHLPGGSADSARMRELVGPAGYHDELRMVARDGDGVWGGVNLFRADGERGFDESDVRALAELSEAVARGLRLGLVAGRVDADGGKVPVGPAVLVVDHDANIRRMSAGTVDLLDEFHVGPHHAPMDSLVRGLAIVARRHDAGEEWPVPRARLRSSLGRWLVAQAAPLAARAGITGEVVVTVDEARPAEVMPLIATAFGLTSREREVTQHVLGGSDTKTIAADLSMSRYTVQDHLKSIFDKADVRSRGQLIARVFSDHYATRGNDEDSPTGWFSTAGRPDVEPATVDLVALGLAEPGLPRLHDGSMPRDVGLVGRDAPLERARSLAIDGVGSLFLGEAGVGKTRLVDEVLESLKDHGWHTERFVAAEATREVPFGALLSLLPEGASDLTEQLTGIRMALNERATGRPTVLAVDDVHLLDEESVRCLVDLTHNTDVVLIGTARSTEPVHPDLTGLWLSEAVVRIDLEPLGRDDAAELARRLLGAPVGDDLADQIWTRTRGVPLFVRELLLDAAAQGLVTSAGEVWELSGKLTSGTRVRDMVTARMALLPPRTTALIELLAVAEPLAVDALTEDERRELDRLEERRLARSEQISGRWIVRVDHPLVAEAIVAAMSTRRRLELLAEAAGRVAAATTPLPGDALRAATWLDECHAPIPAAVALAAGREALSALALDRARALGELAVDELPREAHLLVGEVLRLQGRAAEAEAALEIAADLADDDATIVQVAMWRSTLRAHHADDPEGALALLSTAADRVTAPERALELRSEAAFLAGILGRLAVAADTNRQILRMQGLTTQTEWTAMMNLLFAQVMLADLTDIDRPITGMAGMLDEVGPARPEEVDLYWALVAASVTLGGDLARCEADYVPHVERRADTGRLHGITAAIIVHPLLYRGSTHTATIAELGCGAADETDPFRAGPIARAGQVFAYAQAGDAERARQAHLDLDPFPTGDLRLDGFIGRADAAVLALEGRFDDAAELVADIGRHCIDGTYVQLGMLSLYDAVRYGRADLVVDDMQHHGARTTASLIDTMVAHATAQADGDVAGLVEAAGTFAATGARTLVAEVLDDLARVAEDQVTVARAVTTAALWRRATPFPNALARPLASPLSERELDIVERAMRGSQIRAIAEQLFTSTRTVEVQLDRVIAELGVDAPTDLVDVLVPQPPHPDQPSDPAQGRAEP